MSDNPPPVDPGGHVTPHPVGTGADPSRIGTGAGMPGGTQAGQGAGAAVKEAPAKDAGDKDAGGKDAADHDPAVKAKNQNDWFKVINAGSLFYEFTVLLLLLVVFLVAHGFFSNFGTIQTNAVKAVKDFQASSQRFRAGQAIARQSLISAQLGLARSQVHKNLSQAHSAQYQLALALDQQGTQRANARLAYAQQVRAFEQANLTQAQANARAALAAQQAKLTQAKTKAQAALAAEQAKLAQAKAKAQAAAQAAINKAQNALASAEARLGALQAKAQQAAGRVASAEAALSQALASHNASRIAHAEAALAAAQAAAQKAASAAASAQAKVTQALAQLSAALDRLLQAGLLGG